MILRQRHYDATLTDRNDGEADNYDGKNSSYL